jgi:hypothetical protein
VTIIAGADGHQNALFGLFQAHVEAAFIYT